MPYINHEYVEPREAVARGYCPECGKDLSQTYYELEVGNHWPHGKDPSLTSKEGIERMDMLAEYYQMHPRPQR